MAGRLRFLTGAVAALMVLSSCVGAPPSFEPPPSEDPDFVHFVGIAEGTGNLARIVAQARDRARAEASAYLSASIQSELELVTTEDSTEFTHSISIRSQEVVTRLEFVEEYVESFRDDAGRSVTRVSSLARMLRPQVFWAQELARLTAIWDESVVGGDNGLILGAANTILHDPMSAVSNQSTSAAVGREQLLSVVQGWLSGASDRITLSALAPEVAAGSALPQGVTLTFDTPTPFDWDLAILEFPDGSTYTAPVVDSRVSFPVPAWPQDLRPPEVHLLVSGASAATFETDIAVVPLEAGLRVVVEPVDNETREFLPDSVAADLIRAVAAGSPEWFAPFAADDTGQSVSVVTLHITSRVTAETPGFSRLQMTARGTGTLTEHFIDSATSFSARGDDPAGMVAALVDAVAGWLVNEIIDTTSSN